MNRNRYRLVFNKLRGLLMAVAETAASHSKASAETHSDPTAAQPEPITGLLVRSRRGGACLLLGVAVLQALPLQAFAQIAVDRNAPTNQQPTVLNASNGVPQINIQTPNGNGVSRNTYTQFDVLKNGVILNNSRTDTQTQLGGWVQGNPWLAAGAAKVILNEVNSNNPSLLKGYIEVAGDRAQVVIANPSGISCDGCGFVNANRTTLTTGTPIFGSGGSLDAYRVQGGTISIDGLGMDASRADYTDIIARAVKINAGLWANNLKVTGGTNQVNAAHSSITPIAGTGATPTYAIDVAALGGMYAGNIYLVGTESGLGVRNAGQIGASVGEVVVTVDGRLENSGKLSSAGTIIATATSAQNFGILYAKGDVGITTQGNIQNDGQLLAQGNLKLAALGTTSRIDNGADAILAAGIQSDGKLAGNGGITLNATQGITALGSNVSSGDQTYRAADIDLNGSQTQGANVTLTADTGSVNLASATLASSQTLNITAAQTVSTDGAKVSAKQAQVTAKDLSNKAGQIGAQQDMTLTLSGKLDNSQGLLWAGGTLSATADSIDNHQTPAASAAPDDKLGIQGKSVTLTTGSLDNTSSFVLADDTVDIQANRQLTNLHGTIASAAIVKVRDVQTTRSLAIDNTDGGIAAGTELTLASRSYIGAGSLTSQDKLSFTTDTDTTQSGTLQAAGDMNVQVAGTLTNQGTFSAGNKLTLTAATLDNQATGVIEGTSLALKATDTHTFNNRGLINGGDTFIDAITLNNLGTGRIYGDHVALSATTLNNTNENGTSPTIAARTWLDLGVGSLNNDTGALIFSAGGMDIGGSLDSDHFATGRAGAIANNGGTIQALGSLGITADSISNTNTKFSARAVNSSSVVNRTSYSTSIGVITSDQITSISSVEGWYGPILGYGVLSADYSANQYVYVTLKGSSTPRQITVYSFVIESYHPLGSQVLSTAPGQILSGGDMVLDATQTLTNDKSHIVAGGALDITGTSVHNVAAQVSGTEYHSGTYRPWAYAGHVGKSSDIGCDCDTFAFDVQPYAANVNLTITSPVFVTKDHQTSSAGASIPSLGTPGSGMSGAPTGKNAGPSTSPATLTVPTASLYHTNPSANSRVLVETDPTFANYRTWLSSDYMLKALSLDPALTQKRLGDGFYEQQLIREQVAQLTGRRFLTGYTSEEAQYQALMTSGVTYAKAHNLVPGVALSAKQVAELTSDIVWLETQTVKLADGSTQQVLVPHVYVVPKAGDVSGTGTLLAGADVYIKTSGDLTNSGTIAGRDLVSFDGKTLNNLGGRIAGATTLLDAKEDINNIGGRIEAVDLLSLQAGRDINVTTTTASGSGSVADQTGSGTYTRTQVDRVAGLYVTGDSGGWLLAQAGRDMTLTAAQVSNSSGNTTLIAKNNLTLATVTTKDTADVALNGGYAKSSQSTEVGSSLQSAGNLTLSAGQDLNARAAVAQAGGDLNLTAKRNINITAGESHVESDVRVDIDRGTSGGFGGMFGSSDHTTYIDKNSATAGVASSFSGGTVTTKSGGDTTVTGSTLTADKALTMSADGNIKLQTSTRKEASFHSQQDTSDGFLSDSQSLDTRKAASTQAEGSLVSGDTVSITSKQNVTVSGSNVVATKDLAITAGKTLSIEAAENTYLSKETHDKETSGLFSGGGIGVTWGNRAQRQTQDGEGITHTGSSVGSVEGNVTLKAGEAYSQMGSSVTAPGGDISITAPKVDIGAVYDTSKTKQTFEMSQSGLSFTITSPVLSAVQTAQQMSQAASQTKDSRMKALAAANTAFAAKNAADAVNAGQGDANGKVAQYDANGNKGSRDANAADQAGGIDISLSIGSSNSSSQSTQTSSTAVGSTVSAGKNLTINATAGDLTAIGSTLTAGNDASLSATGNINLLAAKNTITQQSTNDSGSASIGIGFKLGGQQNGFTLNLGASSGQGKDKGNDLSWTNTTVSAGNKATLKSGQDTNLIGASVSANQVQADVGGNLNIVSLQDSSTYKSDSSSAGFGASLCIPPFCYGTPSTVTVNASKAKIKSNYDSVTEQSGIQAGNGGFQVTVKGNTDLKGAVIASTDKAVQDGKNSFSTGGTLTLTDLQNKADYQADSISVSVGTSMGSGAKLSGSGGIGSDSGSASSTTKSGISGIAGNKDVRTGDGANGIAKIFDATTVKNDINAQTQITQTFNSLAPKAAATYASSQAASLKKQADAETDPEKKATLISEAKKWEPNGSYNVAMNIIIGIAGGNASSAISKEMLSWAANEMRQAMIEDSKKFKGICDNQGHCISNISGESVGVNGDNIKIAGGRIILQNWCSEGRCEPDPKTKTGYAENPDGTVKFNPTDKDGNPISLSQFIEEHPLWRSPLGGHQGGGGQMELLGIQFNYAKGSFWDKLAEAYGGTHDTLNSIIWYDELGNGKNLNGTVIGSVGDATNITNVFLATPFALSVLLPPDVWNAVMSAATK